MGKPKTQQLITEAKHLLVKGDKYQAYRRLLMIEQQMKASNGQS